MEWKTLYRLLRTLNWIILLVLSLFSYFLMSSPWTTGVILGGLITIANFNLLQHTIQGVFSSNGFDASAKVSVVAKFYLRLIGLGVLLFVLITRGWVDPVGLAVGLSTVVFSIVGIGISMALKTSATEAT
jgi:ATP synthase I chain